MTNAMREQSARNLFDSETLGLQREAFYTQRQLAMHSLRDRAQARIDYNQGLAEGRGLRGWPTWGAGMTPSRHWRRRQMRVLCKRRRPWNV